MDQKVIEIARKTRRSIIEFSLAVVLLPFRYSLTDILANPQSSRPNAFVIELHNCLARHVHKGITSLHDELLLRHAALLAEAAEGGECPGAGIDQNGDVLLIAAEVEVGVVDVVAGELQRQFVQVRWSLGEGE